MRSAFSDSIRLGVLDGFLSTLSAEELQRLHYDFEIWARDDQLPPASATSGGDWTTWLMLGGRGEANGLHQLEEKALSVGSGPDGGYLVPEETEVARPRPGLSQFCTAIYRELTMPSES